MAFPSPSSLEVVVVILVAKITGVDSSSLFSLLWSPFSSGSLLCGSVLSVSCSLLFVVFNMPILVVVLVMSLLVLLFVVSIFVVSILVESVLVESLFVVSILVVSVLLCVVVVEAVVCGCVVVEH